MRFTAWRQTLSDQVWVVLLVAALLVNGVIIYRQFLVRPVSPILPPPEAVPPAPEIPAGLFASPLNGAPVNNDVAVSRPILVSIDNHTSARPQLGLDRADLIWELMVEGGATRLLAVYQNTDEIQIGPVRSARSYFLPLAAELGAVFAHSGGSVDALAALKKSTIINDADEFTNGRAYFRVAEVARPHNLHTSTRRLQQLVADKEWSNIATITSWPAANEPPEGGEVAGRLTINFAAVPAYRVQWRYDKEAKQYLRSQGGVVVSDRASRRQLSASTVIVQFVNVTAAPPPAPNDAVIVDVVGEGEAWFFRDGQIYRGRWEKPTIEARTVFRGPDKQPFNIVRGTVWVEMVPVAKRADLTVTP